MIVLKNVLIATDFSDASKVALDYGRDLARAYGATLHVLHVVEDVTYSYGGEVGFALPNLQEELEATARKSLEQLVTEDDRKSLRLITAIDTKVNAATGITGYATAKSIDLIVVGTHGRGGMQHLLMGSVAERVVRTASCPVLTVRAHEREFIAPDELVPVAAVRR
jgi:nucleotide-binding universal stress UspA family protein